MKTGLIILLGANRQRHNNMAGNNDRYIRRSKIAFLDVLGIKNKMIDNEGHLDESLFNSLCNSIDTAEQRLTFRNRLTNEKISKIIEYNVFSDSIIVHDAYENFDISMYIFLLGLIQAEFIKNGLFLRGGFSKGEILEQSNCILSNGIVKAHQLENEIAIWPRIVVDIKSINQEGNTDLPKHVMDWDVPFIDYFSVCYELGTLYEKSKEYYRHLHKAIDDGDFIEQEIEESKKELYSFINAHRLNIIKNIADATDLKILQKFKYLKHYHNCSVRRFGIEDSFII